MKINRKFRIFCHSGLSRIRFWNPPRQARGPQNDNCEIRTNNKRYSLFASIKLAAGGIWRTVKGERNMRIHLIAALSAVTLGLALGISRFEWLVIILIIFAVLSAEVFNSAIEEVADVMVEKLSLGYQETKWARDMAAGAVLLLAIGAVILGLIIFLPHFLFFRGANLDHLEGGLGWHLRFLRLR